MPRIVMVLPSSQLLLPSLVLGQFPFASCPRSLSSRKRGAGIHFSIKAMDFGASDDKLAHSPSLTILEPDMLQVPARLSRLILEGLLSL